MNRLYVFAISHYCEKACWALEWLGVEHVVEFLAPGPHQVTAKKLGARRSSLPILVADGEVVQGSARIIDWADARAEPERRLTPEAQRDECLAIEKRLDDVAGVHVRRYYYSEALVDHPATVRPIFTKDLPLAQRLLVRATWPAVRRLMIHGMDLGPDQRLDSRAIVEAELDWVDGLLSDGRRHLVGDRLSRADLAAASLLSPLAIPAEHPTYAGLSLPPMLADDVANWQDRPSMTWVRDIYARFRQR